ncbi:DUF2510 domain-containing protein [Microbacterium sp.]|uniref:DUF2510 domain-containing protein n=1 Tax=Microbacterium sp. TaxID=51671 RepID=UPI003341F942
MTQPAAPAPPGWYPDATGTLRWWDGVAWSAAAMSAPAPIGPEPVRPVPQGTRVNTVWIWLVVAVPALQAIIAAGSLVLMQQSMTTMLQEMQNALIDSGRIEANGVAVWMNAMTSAMGGLTALSLLSFVLYGVGVVFAALDHQELGRLGYQRRFHWAWNFLSPVYPIGRSIVVRRQAGRGVAPMWVAIAITAATWIGSVIWSFVLMQSILSATLNTVTQFS